MAQQTTQQQTAKAPKTEGKLTDDGNCNYTCAGDYKNNNVGLVKNEQNMCAKTIDEKTISAKGASRSIMELTTQKCEKKARIPSEQQLLGGQRK